jgi:NDP-sugar pyrophosphorylase family protein
MTKRHCVVLAGGLGTRLRDITRGSVPKALVPVLGRPFLHYKLRSLREMGIDEVTLLVGELGHLVEEYVVSREDDGLNCTVIHDGPMLLGTAGSIARALPFLPEVFWITYGDSYGIADLKAAETKMKERGLSAVMTVLHNSDQLEISNTKVECEVVVDYRKGAVVGTFEFIDYGLLYLQRDTFSILPTHKPVDLSEVICSLVDQRTILAYEVSERFWDVGTPQAHFETEVEFRRRNFD